MKKQINIKNSIIVILCITIICLGIGFIVLSVELENKNKQVFDVSFNKIEKLSSLKGGIEEPIGNLDIISNGKILNMAFELNHPHDELIYKVTIKNQGTLPAKIIDIIETPDYSNTFANTIKPISISYTDIEGKTLDVGETTEIKISISYDPSEINKKQILYLKLGIISESI